MPSHENTGLAQYLRLGAIAAAYFLRAWIARSRYFERAYLKTAYLASLFIALVVCVEVATWIAAGVGEMFALLTLHSLGLYFLAGILFRAAVRYLGIEHVGNDTVGVVTVSIGVGIVRPRLDRSPEGLVRLADEALYTSKKDGRNRVKVFEEYAALSTGKFQSR